MFLLDLVSCLFCCCCGCCFNRHLYCYSQGALPLLSIPLSLWSTSWAAGTEAQRQHGRVVDLLLPFWGGETLKNGLLAFSFASCSHLQLKWTGFLWLLKKSHPWEMQNREEPGYDTAQKGPPSRSSPLVMPEKWCPGCRHTAHSRKAFSSQDVPTEMQKLEDSSRGVLQDKNKIHGSRSEIHLLALSFKAQWNAHSSFQLPASKHFSLRSCS